MYVENFIPTAVEIPDSVAEAKWKVKLRFLKLTTLWYAVSFLLIWGIALFFKRPGAVNHSLALLAIGTLALSVPRTLFRQRREDGVFSLILSPGYLLLVGYCFGRIWQSGVPIWSMLAPWFAATCYTFLCGRDFSFVGQFALSLIFTLVSLSLYAIQKNWPAPHFLLAATLAISYLVYFCWDLASLMSRRRENEALIASIDLYRDVLNFLGYSFRCVKHWKQNRFFLDPWLS